jgi:hypothetical protein
MVDFQPCFVMNDYNLGMVRDRLIAWEYGTRPGHDWFPEGWSFRDYAERYIVSYRLFEPAIP